MKTDLTPNEARKLDAKTLTEWANECRPLTGIHTVVTNEINRRHNRHIRLESAVISIVVALIVSSLYVWLRG